mgnify:CR=1 FL=1
MTSFLSKIRIPTLAGLTVIILGMTAGIYLTLSQQTITTQAAPELTPKNIKITNIEDVSASISWITDVETTGFVLYSFADNPEQVSIDDTDNQTPSAKLLHHISLKNLIPETTYQFKIASGKLTSAPLEFTTAKKTDNQNEFKPIIGTVQDANQLLKSGLVYLETPGAVTQSAVIKSPGNFILPLSKIRTDDLSDIFKDKDAEAILTIITDKQTSATARFIPGNINGPIGLLTIGQNVELDLPVASPSALLKFDLNGDGIINASDHSIVLTNQGKKPKVPAADLNEDGVVDRKDLDIISAEIAKLGNQ